MNEQPFPQYIEASDGHKIALHCWLPDDEIEYIVQLSHGMVEYAERYQKLGQFLSDRNVALYAHDHRGHGKCAEASGTLGFLAEQNGFDKVLDDLRIVIEYVKTRHSGKKIVLLGHSFGSFISQGYVERYGDYIDACILSGSAGPRLFKSWAARQVASVICFFKGSRYRSEWMNNLIFAGYNKKIPHPQSKNAWLTRDENVVKEYDQQTLTTFIPTIRFFCDLFGGLLWIHKKKAINRIPRKLPILIFSGDHDPVGDYGKSVKNLYQIYRSIGIADVKLILYPGGRHEMLNEINKAEVMTDLYQWMEQRITD